MIRRPLRTGFTLLEVLVVMAIMVILAGVSIPTLRSFNRDTRVKAGADLVRSRISQARGAAVTDNVPYRLAVSSDGLQIRVAPDDANFASFVSTPTDDHPEGQFVSQDALPVPVTVKVVFDDDQKAVTDGDWVRVATFLPDGTCRDDVSIIQVQEPNVSPLWVRIRGLTGSAIVAPAPKGAAR